MLEFKKLTLDDISLLKPFYKYQIGHNCDATIGGTFMWRDFFKTEFTIYHNVLYFKVLYVNNEEAFTVPLGGKITDIDNIVEYCKLNNKKTVICSVTKNDLKNIETHYNIEGKKPERDWFDYLYHAKDLVELKGKKYHGQKNHINKFKSLYPNHRFSMIDESNIGDVIQFYRSYLKEYNKLNHIAVEEKEKTLEVLENIEKYSLFGGILYIDDKVAAFSLGEINNDVLYVHIEKADIAYKGIYPMLVNQFAKQFVNENVLFINREEDVGDLGLRSSKLSYHPVELIEKYIIKI